MEKNGSKRHSLVDGRGVPLSIIVSGANEHDCTLLSTVLAAVVIKRPESEQHLCADKGYFGGPQKKIIHQARYVPHVRSRGEEKKECEQGKKARRWVVEASQSWMNRYRKLLVRYEKKTRNYQALCSLAAALTAFRQVITIYG